MSKSNLKHDSAELHVTGRAEYIDDRMFYQNEVFVGLFTSPFAKAKILKIDFSKAAQVVGVLGIYAANDIRQNIWGNIFHDQPYLASNEVNYAGEPILVIAAESLEAIHQVKKSISVEFDVQKPILSIAEARKNNMLIGPLRKIQRGDVDACFKSAKSILSGVITTGGQDHFYLESHACIAYPKERGQIEIHSSSQHPSEVQQLVAEALGLKFNQVVCIVKRMGGGFGGKESQAAPFAVYAALVAKRLNRPARLVLTKDEDMQITGKRNPFENHYRVAFDEKGKIVALDVELFADGGAYADLSTAIMERAMLHSDNAYFIENMRVSGQVCRTNTASNTAFRGFGGPQGMVTIENIIEEIASKLKLDSLDVRQMNAYRKGQKTHYGQTITDDLLPELFSKLRKDCDYDQRQVAIEKFNSSNIGRFKGLSLTPIKFGISFTTRFLNQANSLVHVLTDGTVQVSTGATEMGQGVNTKISQVVSEVFGIKSSDVIVMPTSTEKNANTSATAASSGSDLNGRAAEAAALDIKTRLEHVAAEMFKRPKEWRGKKVAGAGIAPEIKVSETVQNSNLEFENGFIVNKQTSDKISWQELVQEAYLNRISLTGYGFYKYPGIHFNKETGQGEPFFYFTNGVAASEVSIDKYTGEVKFLRCDILMDLGRTQIEGIDRGQVTGAFVQGLGWVTTEKLYSNEQGQLKTFSPSTYKIPGVHDIPRIFNIEFLENDSNLKNIKGSKAVGEPPLMLAISVWTAIKRAVFASYRTRQNQDTSKVQRLPVPATQEAILEAMS